MAYLIPCLWGLSTVLLLGWTLACLEPFSPLRPLMLSVVLAASSVTAFTAPSFSTTSFFNLFLGLYFGMLISLEATDHICILRLHLKKSSRDGSVGLVKVIRWTADSICNKRKIGTPNQVKNVPHFDSRRPDYVPTRLHFLLFRTARFIAAYLLLDLLLSIPSPDPHEKFDQKKEFILGRMAARQVTFEEFVERAILTTMFWISSYIFQLVVYDLLSMIAVGCLLNKPEDWPPRFGSISDAYTIRRFWGIFWHQDLRRCLTSNSSVIVHQILQIPKKSIVGRYANIFFAFFLSGLVHIQNDRLLRVPLAENSALYFFLAQALGIMVEDAVQHIFGGFAGKQETGSGRSGHERPSLGRRLFGFVWVALFLTWMTPIWSFPVLRTGTSVPLPVHFFKAFV